MSLEILHRNDLQLGDFAGLKEHCFVMDPHIFGSSADSGSWSGIGNFVYLADAKFIPKGETHLHPHSEIDVISVIIDGRISHEGTLETGNVINTNQVQVQRAGREGFTHNEVNPDDEENRMIQIWVTPEKQREPTGYKLYSLQQGKILRVYGGTDNQDETFASQTIIDVGLIDANQKISFDGEFIAYVTKGEGTLNGELVVDGDLIHGNNLTFEAKTNSQIITVRKI
jgi:redox-sensitive bicupin YhaK (pirin superfamily)